jgi:DcmR-like sensory protein
MTRDTDWKHAKADIFWGDIAFQDHVLQIYDNDELYIEALAGFVSTGLQLGDCCVVILSQAHLKSLNHKLIAANIDIGAMMRESRYVQVDANEVLAKFMVNGMPDGEIVTQIFSVIFEPCQRTQRLIRVAGETSAILLAEGFEEAALCLENMTNLSREQNPYSIFCGYPRSAFKNAQKARFSVICAEHSKMISGHKNQEAQVYYNEEPVS